jgi:hypothetical protein
MSDLTSDWQSMGANNHNDVLPLVRFRHLIMAAFRIFAKCGTRGEPLEREFNRLSQCCVVRVRTKEAASSCREEMYLVATTLSPSVTQKFIRLG